jgi:hypothetical protein
MTIWQILSKIITDREFKSYSVIFAMCSGAFSSADWWWLSVKNPINSSNTTIADGPYYAVRLLCSSYSSTQTNKYYLILNDGIETRCAPNIKSARKLPSVLNSLIYPFWFVATRRMQKVTKWWWVALHKSSLTQLVGKWGNMWMLMMIHKLWWIKSNLFVMSTKTISDLT